MTKKRLFGVVKGHREHIADHTGRLYSDNEVADLLNTVHEENEKLKHRLAISQKANFITALEKENERLKSQLYYDDEEGVCNICKHHYLIKDDEAELGYYNSRCKKGHYECARVSLKHCEDFEKELVE